VSPPEAIDGLSASEPKELVARLWDKMAELERTNDRLGPGLRHLWGGVSDRLRGNGTAVARAGDAGLRLEPARRPAGLDASINHAPRAANPTDPKYFSYKIP
jgi:hypothetical protein